MKKQIASLPLSLLINMASKLSAQGETAAACNMLTEALEHDPASLTISFALIEIYLNAGQHDEARNFVSKSIKREPFRPDLTRHWCSGLLETADKDVLSDTSAWLRQCEIPEGLLVELQQQISDAIQRPEAPLEAREHEVVNKIENLIERAEHDAALVAINSAMSVHSATAQLTLLRARVLTNLQRYSEAIREARRAAEQMPIRSEAWEILAEAYLNTNNPSQALSALEKARKLNPGNAEIMRNLAKAYLNLKMVKPAMEHLDQSVQLDPSSPETYYLKANTCFDTGDFPGALASIQSARKLGVKTEESIGLEARTLRSLNRADDALDFMDTVIDQFPDSGFLYYTRAQLLQSLGRFTEADASFSHALRVDPENNHSYRALAASHKFAPGDTLIPELEQIWLRKNLAPQDRAVLGFTLAKAMDDIGQYDRSFRYLDTANRLQRALQPYDISKRHRQIEEIRAFFSGFHLNDHPLENSDESFAPVFVAGLPRSGTTLVEQIISSHSQITGAGEIDRLTQTAAELVNRPSVTRLTDITQDEIRAIADDYKKFASEFGQDGGQISDKSLHTYMYIGFIWLALPQARIVVVRRDPRDNLFSIYKNMFGEGRHLYSYDLNDLAEVYKTFDDLIAFWRKISPGRIYEIHYEDLVRNPELETRKLLEAIDLPLEDACLAPEKNPRQVDTLSVYQVRQPVYHSSIGAWKHYEKDLNLWLRKLDL